MKKLLMLFTVVFSLSSCSDDSGIEIPLEPPVATICPVGNVLITKQSDTNIFINKYKGCTEISGSLTISLNAGNLNYLKDIVSVSGDLKISGNKVPADLSVLNNLKSIGGNLIVTRNTFTSLIDFQNLESVGGNIVFDDNELLKELKGFPKLQHVEGSLLVEDNRALSSIDIFEKIKQFNGDILIKGNMVLTHVQPVL